MQRTPPVGKKSKKNPIPFPYVEEETPGEEYKKVTRTPVKPAKPAEPAEPVNPATPIRNPGTPADTGLTPDQQERLDRYIRRSQLRDQEDDPLDDQAGNPGDDPGDDPGDSDDPSSSSDSDSDSDEEEGTMADKRTSAIRSRTAYYGHLTRRNREVQAWINKAAAEINTNPIREATHTVWMKEGEELLEQYGISYRKVEEAHFKVLKYWDEQNGLPANQQQAGSADPESNWIIDKEDLHGKWRKELQSYIDRFRAAFKKENDDRVASQKAADAGKIDAAKTMELKQRFRITEHIPTKFTGEDIDFVPWFQQWERTEKIMQLMFSKAEMLIKLKSVLDKEPKAMLSGLIDTDDSYLAAKQLLKARYYNMSTEIRRLLTISKTQGPMMGCARTRQAVLNEHQLLIQRFDGLRISKESRYELFIMDQLEKSMDNYLKKEWYEIVEQKKDDKDPLGSTARLEDLIELIKKHINIAAKNPNAASIGERNEKIRQQISKQNLENEMTKRKQVKEATALVVQGNKTHAKPSSSGAKPKGSPKASGGDKGQAQPHQQPHHHHPQHQQQQHSSAQVHAVQSKPTYQNTNKNQGGQRNTYPQNNNSAAYQFTRECPFCGKEHQRLFQCEARAKLPLRDQLQKLNKARRCFGCGGWLRQDENRKITHECNARPCQECNGRHRDEYHTAAIDFFREQRQRKQAAM